jgi:oligosaccharyltransferase complex subunit gamma
MQLWSAVLASVLSFGAIVSASEYDSKSLAKLVGSDGLIKLNDNTFADIVTGPRDYAIAVLLTAAAPQFGCAFCHVIGPQFAKVARSWHDENPSGDGLFFAIADLPDNQQIYQMLGLTHAPNLWIYPPTTKKHGIETGYNHYEFPTYEEQALPLIGYIQANFGKTVTIREPVDYSRIIVTLIGLLVSVGAFAVFRKQVFFVFRSTKVWTALSLIAVLLFTSGYMFNVIRRTPNVGGSPNNIQYFVPGHSNQVAIETQIIAVVYAVMAFSVIALIARVPRLKISAAQAVAAAILSIVFLVGLSVIVNAFKLKNGGYPFSILKIF